MALPQSLTDIPMNLTPPEDEASGLPPEGLPPAGAPPEEPDGDEGLPPPGGKEVQAPPSQLSGGTWERLSPGQFAYHPSPEDLQMPDLPGHFAEIEVVGDLLIMPNGDIYEGGIAHDIDGDNIPDEATHFGKDPDAELSAPGSKLPPSGGPTSWMNKRSTESEVPIPKQNY